LIPLIPSVRLIPSLRPGAERLDPMTLGDTQIAATGTIYATRMVNRMINLVLNRSPAAR
jgi:hypothetical protein